MSRSNARAFLGRLPLVVLLALAAAPAPARATEASASEVIELAADARQDPAALERLREVSSIDGRAVDLDAALGESGGDLDARLIALERQTAASLEASPLDAEEAGRRASELGAAQPAAEPAPEAGTGSGFETGLPQLPLGWTLAIILLALGAGVVLARAASRRAVAEDRALARAEDGARPRRQRDLDREADEAERTGDFAAAVRSRFAAGISALEASGRLRPRPSLTASGAARELGSPERDRIAADYIAIVYARRPASAEDAERARTGWRQILRAGRAR